MKDERTLEELFRDIGSNKHYGLMGTSLRIGTVHGEYEVPINVQMDAESNSKFVSFLVHENSPPFPRPGEVTAAICRELATQFASIKIQYVDNASAYSLKGGETPSDKAKRMAFSGQAYIYSNGTMTPQQMYEIEQTFKAYNVNVTFRSFEYLRANSPKSEVIWKWP